MISWDQVWDSEPQEVLADIRNGLQYRNRAWKIWPEIQSSRSLPAIQPERDKEIIRTEQQGPTSTRMYSQMGSRFHSLVPPHLLFYQNEPTHSLLMCADGLWRLFNCFITFLLLYCSRNKGWGGGGRGVCEPKNPLSPVCYLSLTSACDECWCFEGGQWGWQPIERAR